MKYQEIIIKVPDMACDGCAKKISKALKSVSNIHKIKINLDTKEITILYKNDLDLFKIREIIEKLGYQMI